jgi:hypothetical protein
MADDFILPPPSGGSRVGDLRARLSSLVAAATPLAAAPSPAAAAAASAAAPNVDEEGEVSLSASAVDLSVVSPGGVERANAARFRGDHYLPFGLFWLGVELDRRRRLPTFRAAVPSSFQPPIRNACES